MADSALDGLLRRDRAVVAAALAVQTAFAWAYVLWLADDMAMGGMDMTGFRMIPAGSGYMMPALAPWTAIEFLFVFAMWAAMMVGMMMPSAAPMILIYARVGRKAGNEGKILRRRDGSLPVIYWCGPVSRCLPRRCSGRSSGRRC